MTTMIQPQNPNELIITLFVAALVLIYFIVCVLGGAVMFR